MSDHFDRMCAQALRVPCPHCHVSPNTACQVEVPYSVGWGPWRRDKYRYVETTPHTTRIGQGILTYGPVP